MKPTFMMEQFTIKSCIQGYRVPKLPYFSKYSYESIIRKLTDKFVEIRLR